MNRLNILALESSCDDTAAAIVADGRRVLSTIVACQNDQHRPFGGVVPEVAARLHIDHVNDCIEQALAEAALTLNDIDAFAATLGPGLIGSLLVGANAAKSLSVLTGKPFLGVHHLMGHVASNFLESDLEPPFLCLLVSGGHTQLIHVKPGYAMSIVGETLDDAVGEAYDKVGRLMEAGFPGGPAIDRLAAQGNPHAFRLPIARTREPFDFSFSGLKTAVSRQYEQARQALESDTPEAKHQLQADLAASFQATVVKTLFDKTVACAESLGITTIAIAGGVSANRGLRARFNQWVTEHEVADHTEASPHLHVYIPALPHCTDNAAMIASAAYFNPLTRDLAHEVFSRQPLALKPAL